MSQTPIWAKGQTEINESIQQFCAADDVIVDRDLFCFDIKASIAHVNGLKQIGVLDQNEQTILVQSLQKLLSLWNEKKFTLDERYEDGHSAIESYLIECCGEIGKKVHTARSRNDQVLVAQRLWLKEQLTQFALSIRESITLCLAKAQQTQHIAMPGYTHLQRAMPMSLANFFAAHGESFIDSLDAILSARKLVDKNPLGTGAGFGVSLPLARDFVTEQLGMNDVLISPQAAQNSRGKIELFALQAVHLLTLDIRRLAWDLSLFFTSEFQFVRLPNSFTTGSSLMPNKRNPDVIELLRTLPSVVEGAMAEIQSVLSLPSNYHRDLQATKAPVVRAMKRALLGVQILPSLIKELEFNESQMKQGISGDMFATDRALELVVSGVPFRDAYKQAASEIPELEGRDPAESLQKRVSLGGAQNLGLDRLQSRLQGLK